MIDPVAALDRTVLVLQDYVAASERDVLSTLGSLRVRLHASADDLAAPTARLALVTAFEAIARLGVEVVLEIPDDVAAGDEAPPLADESLFRALHTLASRLIRPLGAAGACDLHVTLGREVRDTDIGLSGSDFEARVSVGHPGDGWTGVLPFGAVLAGSFAGAEVARLAVRRLREAGAAPIDHIPLDHRDIAIKLAPFDYPAEGIDLGCVDVISAGAITHALLFTLARIPHLRLSGRVFDDDFAADDNLNRYVLLDAAGLGVPKEKQIADLEWPAFELTGVHGRVGEGELASVRLADRVCVGVDSVEARWDIQRLCQGWVGIGATTHALAMASQHWPGTPCAGCVHPERAVLVRRLPTISFVSLLAGALLAHRVVQAAVAPVQMTEVAYVLDALNLASAQPFVVERPVANRQCPVKCDASRASESTSPR